MNTDTSSMTSNTTSMTARTQSFNYQPSRTALATRALSAVDDIRDPEERYQAFSRFMDEYPPLIAQL